MTVKELIQKLQKYPADCPVVVWDMAAGGTALAGQLTVYDSRYGVAGVAIEVEER